jgi:hypothetical protein
MKYLVPLARANRADGERLGDAVAPLKLTTRQMAIVHAAWSGASVATRELILKDPTLVVRAHEEARRAREHPEAAHPIFSDLGALGGIAGRLYQRVRRGELASMLAPEREEIGHVFAQARREMVRLIRRWEEEFGDARSEHPHRDPATA